MPGKLYVVATPIGNLEDITFRAVRTLKIADLILAEDTRHTKILLDHYKIVKPLISYHQHSKLQKIDYILKRLKIGNTLALVCDAGTPGISDPGSKLISIAVENNIEVEAIPGPSAFLSALSMSGFDTSKFLYLGFFPLKKGRQTLMKKIANYPATVVFYESPHRIIKTLKELKSYVGDKEIMVARELTKKFETIYRGKASEVIEKIKPKGEFVVVIGKGKKNE